MYSLKISNTKNTFLLIFIFSLILLSYTKTIVDSTLDPHYVWHDCKKTNNTYIWGSVFQAALNDTLYSKLPYKALKAIFDTFTNGTGVDQVNALYYCRGDVGASTCSDCVVAAAQKATAECKFIKEAIIWFEECTLRYANRNISFIEEEYPVKLYTNSSGIINDHLLDPFKEEFDGAMEEVIQQAANSRNLQGFAMTNVNLSSTTVLHCTVQCTPDISGDPCERCLKSALSQRDKWADTMVFMPSCFMRIDLFNSTISASTRPDEQHPHGLPTAIVIAIIAVVGFVVAAAVFCYFIVSYLYPKDLKPFTYEELRKATRDFNEEASNKLGEDSEIGEVFEGDDLRSYTKVAVMVLNKEIYERPREFLLDLKNYSRDRKNAVNLIGYCTEGKHRIIVYEFAEYYSLYFRLSRATQSNGARDENVTWENRMKIAVGVAETLEQLHNTSNSEINQNKLLKFETKVTQFALAKVCGGDNCTIATEKSAVYSFGIMLLKLIDENNSIDNTGKKIRELLQSLGTSGGSTSTATGQTDYETPAQIYNDTHKSRMIVCAAMCLHADEQFRINFNQVVRLLKDGSLRVSELNDIIQQHSAAPIANVEQESSDPDILALDDLIKLAKRRLRTEQANTVRVVLSEV